ncbi:hypothetical protein GIB67_039195 [Kingdonia uniflora]|uniref:Dof zinc finger protein n=1 Tax=Kingdonia uniflora TaxID=39325 RepID=A0A7J7MM35_9MAGN|nr:hypothetical protein GIB67_039195 [Kingdonia uniflora]
MDFTEKTLGELSSKTKKTGKNSSPGSSLGMNFECEDGEGECEDGDAIPLYAQFIDGNHPPGQKFDKKRRSLNTSFDQIMYATTKISESFNESVTMKIKEKEDNKVYGKSRRETKDELARTKLESLRLYKEHAENVIRKQEMQVMSIDTSIMDSKNARYYELMKSEILAKIETRIRGQGSSSSIGGGICNASGDLDSHLASQVRVIQVHNLSPFAQLIPEARAIHVCHHTCRKHTIVDPSRKDNIILCTAKEHYITIDESGMIMASNDRVMEKQGQDQPQPVQQQPQPVLKCPRCDSSNTKFCYYNNYSLSQPRHFCKACKRYWTRGGTLRNVPVGGGYRKNKRVKRPTNTSEVASSSLTSNPKPNQHSHQISAMSSLFYNLPNDHLSSYSSSTSHHPFHGFCSSTSSENTLPISYTSNIGNNQAKLSAAMGLYFPNDAHYENYGVGAGFNHPTQIQEMGTTSNSLLSNFSLLGSLSSSYAIASSLEKRKLIEDDLKESRPSTSSHMQALLPFEDLQVSGDRGVGIVRREDKMGDQGVLNACPNQIELNVSSSLPFYWNPTSDSAWPDSTNYGSSGTSLI